MADEARSSRLDVVRALREAGWTGLIAFGLFLPLIGFNTVQNIHNELVLETRWPLLAVLVAIVAVGRLVWGILPRRRMASAWRAYVGSPGKLALTAVAGCTVAVLASITYGAVAESHVAFRSSLMAMVIVGSCAGIAGAIGCIVAWTSARYPATTEAGRIRRHQIGVALRAAALGFLIVYPLMMLWLTGFQGAIKWIDNFGIQILIYVMLGWGLNIVVGLAGLLDLGYVAFYAVGAYSYALLAQAFGLSFFMLLPLAGIMAAFAQKRTGVMSELLRPDELSLRDRFELLPRVLPFV